MNSINDSLAKFFGVAVRGQTYLNALYLLLAFPLGLFYFVFLITGISVGVPLVIIWIGLLILLGVYAAWYGLIAFERVMAIGLLHEQIPAMTREDLSGKTLWQKFVATLKNPVTWKGLVYLIAKFPLGLLSFIVLVTLVSVCATLIATPFYYQYIPTTMNMTIDGVKYIPLWVIDTLSEALIVSLVGLLLTLVSMHILNGLAWVSGKFARIMLGGSYPEPSAMQPVEITAVEEPSPSAAA